MANCEDAQSAGSSSHSCGVEVFDYTLAGDPLVYCAHEFTIRVWMGQHVYAVQRSYSAFCFFHAALTRKYPRSRLPALPLMGKDLYQKKGLLTLANAQKDNGGAAEAFKSAVGERLRASFSVFDNNGVQTNDTGGNVHAGFGRDSAGRRSIRRVDNTEMINQKKVPLSLYLQQLLTVPEILLSESLLAFLDEASPDGDILDEKTQANPSPVDILLADEVPVHKRVLRQHSVTLNVEEGFVVLWQFLTRKYDIGFAVSYNSADIIAYQRVSSHLKAVTGTFEVPGKGQVTLSFDNAYSRMHTKSLSYSVRVVEAHEYESAKEAAVFKAKEKHALSQQRAMLQRYLLQRNKDLISSTGIAFNVDNSEEARFRTVSTWEGELAKLHDEKKSLAHALEETLSSLEVERNAYAESIGRLESVTASRDAAEEELESLRQQALDERERNAGALEELNDARDRALEAIDEARRLREENRSLAHALAERASALEAERNAHAAAVAQLENVTKKQELAEEERNKLKTQKKQLVAFAKQARADIDALTAVVAEFENTTKKQEIAQEERKITSEAIKPPPAPGNLLTATYQDFSFFSQTTKPVSSSDAPALLPSESFGF